MLIEGYTSISVREPLSRIMANVQNGNGISTDSHYAFVSDDSGTVSYYSAKTICGLKIKGSNTIF